MCVGGGGDPKWQISKSPHIFPRWVGLDIGSGLHNNGQRSDEFSYGDIAS